MKRIIVNAWRWHAEKKLLRDSPETAAECEFIGNHQGETNSSPSLTVPGMTLSLRDLLDKYVREGVTLPAPEWSNDDDIPDGIERLSKTDKVDLARDLRASIDVHRSRKRDAVPTDVRGLGPDFPPKENPDPSM
jgi:hypothetical protein